MKKLFSCSVLILFMMGCASSQPLQTVDKVDLEKYRGQWYEIASYPARFQKGCRCTTAEYELVPGKNYMLVVNRCVKFKGSSSKIASIRGRAYPVLNSENTKLKVQFFWPFRGNYQIIGLAGDYSWALVGTPSRKYLWVLSRESFMTTDTYDEILKIVKNRGYSTSRIQKTPQNCDTPE